ncbi:cytochrome p450 [Moniliophthora roreri]|nr:cytochrome p450 [Moniliophthora roreri]
MNPAFGPSQIRELTEVFVEKSLKLRDVWTSQISQDTNSGRIDALSWLSRMTLDVVGEAGFNYKFNAMEGELNELNEAYSAIFQSGSHRHNLFFVIIGLAQEIFPVFRVIVSSHHYNHISKHKRPQPELDRSLRKAMQTSTRIAKELLYESKRTLASTGEKGNSWRAKDLLSLLVRSNMSTDLPEDQRMSDKDVMSQVPTFLVAGHETTSTATTFALLALTERPDVQTKLREELLTVPTDNPTMDELNALPYLDIVVRETLRYYAPAPLTGRTCTTDDVVPLAEPYIDRNGVVQHQLNAKKGTGIFIPITSINRDKTLWGEDAEQFNPDRWKQLPEAVTSIPGVWGNMLTFLGGSHACIGWRFALVEMKALLFTLVRAFEFELAVPREQVVIKKSALVQRPEVRGHGNQLPLIIKPVVTAD